VGREYLKCIGLGKGIDRLGWEDEEKNRRRGIDEGRKG